MASKIYGSSNPGTTLTDIHDSTAGTGTVAICNRSNSEKTFRIAVVAGGGTATNDEYIYYDTPIPANDTLQSLPISVGASDEVQVYGSTTDVSFVFTGVGD